VETSEDTIPSANPFVTSVQKVAPIVQTGETTMTKTSQPKDQRKVERTSTQTMITMGGIDYEMEKEYEELEFDDYSEVDYDLDYTHSA
tara:strand:- start:5639 stop:5902 length:264 start_codon:yes stop_codon:yes gene_type:complete